MNWRGRLAASGAALALTVCGCLTKVSTLADALPLPAPPPSTNSTPATEVTRAQEPETAQHPPANAAVCRLINLPVDRPAEAQHANSTATIRAVVNGELILDEELSLACQMNPTILQQLYAARTQEERQQIQKQALEDLINREVMLQDAIAKLKRGGKQGEAYLRVIEKAADEEFDKRILKPTLKEKHMNGRQELAAHMREKGMSLEVMRRWWERNYMAQQYLMSKVEQHINRIGHTEISEYYNSHRDEYTQPDSVVWQEIFIDATRHASRVDARQFAESLVQRVRQGEDFVQLSAEFDNGASGRFRKGEGQGHKRGEIFPREAEPLLLQMHEGDLDIVERPRGFHIIRLVKRQYAGPIPFDIAVQKEIRDKLRNIVFQREKESIVKELKRKSVIDRCDGIQTR
ncbi:MAG: peptidylprolyl isomerase [Gemmataceae bacterium]